MSQEYGPGDLLLERYMVDSVIGSGGMATVYRCNDLRLDVVVAVKILRRQFRTKQDVVRRFLREAKLQAKLRHPHIVHVTNVEERDDMTLMVMEYMKGVSLAEYLEAKGMLGEQEAVDLLVPVIDALSMAHTQDVVHRDIKPSNIFLCEEGQKLIPKLMDFGVARELDASITTSSTLLGTLPYMSFELVQSARNGSPASDVYALGVTLFELLTGQYPVQANSLQEYVFAMMELVKARSVRSVRPEVSPELDSVIARALAKGAADRYTNAAELLGALRALPPQRAMASGAGRPAAAPAAQPSGAISSLTTDRPGYADLYTEEHPLGQGPIARQVVCRAHAEKVVVKLLDLELVHDASWIGTFFESVAKQRELCARTHFIQTVHRAHEAFGAVVSPWAEGLTLADYLQRYGALDPRYAIQLFTLLAEALSAAHGIGLLHRHLYPGNILLTQQKDGVMTPQLMDLGHLALLPNDRVDRLGASLCCLAPELGGNLRAATQASDVYALGVSMFHTVTGRPPVEVTTLAGLQAALTRLSTLPDPRDLVPSLPEGLCQVIGWCVALAPEQRYQRVADVLRDLLAVRHQLAGY